MFWSCWRNGSSRGSPTVRSTCWAARRSPSSWSGLEPSSVCQTTSRVTGSRRTGTPAWRWVELCERSEPLEKNLTFLPCVFQTLCEDKTVEEVLRRHFHSSKDFRSLHALLVRRHAFFSFNFSRPRLTLDLLFTDVLSESRHRFQSEHQTGRPAGGQQAVFRRRQGEHAARWEWKSSQTPEGWKENLTDDVCGLSQVCPSWSCALSSPWNTWSTSMKASRSTCRWFTTVWWETFWFIVKPEKWCWWVNVLQSLRSSCRGSPTPCTTSSSRLLWRSVWSWIFTSPDPSPRVLTRVLLPSSGLRAPAAAGADSTGRRFLGEDSEGVPADETDAGPQSDHGGPAEVPTMPHGRQAVGHVGVWLTRTIGHTWTGDFFFFLTENYQLSVSTVCLCWSKFLNKVSSCWCRTKQVHLQNLGISNRWDAAT